MLRAHCGALAEQGARLVEAAGVRSARRGGLVDGIALGMAAVELAQSAAQRPPVLDVARIPLRPTQGEATASSGTSRIISRAESGSSATTFAARGDKRTAQTHQLLVRPQDVVEAEELAVVASRVSE
ncbi:hypothetical protein ACFY0R_19740 [Streptomyces sp. NPDC001633]|uniref:hypothetical protein n=1 Tax=Streptomyces sp. NPDC001633 TaxID=3364595 RepID=UPI0036C7F6B8